MKGAGAPILAWAHLESQEAFSRDSATMEEACAKATATHLGCGTTESGVQQKKNIVLKYVCSPFSLPCKQKKSHAHFPLSFIFFAVACRCLSSIGRGFLR